MHEFNLKSGGASGSDRKWEIIGRDYKCLSQIKHFYIEGYKTPYGNFSVSLSPASKLEIDSYLRHINETFLKRKYPTNSEYTNNLLRRNYLMCLGEVNSLFAIGEIKDKHIQGGTAWGVHSMCFLDKHVYFFDQEEEQWYTISHRDNETLIVKLTNTPTILSKEFIGIGTRKINDAGVQAIRDVYKKSLKL